MKNTRQRTTYSEDPTHVSFLYYVVNKPFMMLSQFTSELGKQTLADLEFVFPTDVYPVGRLDEDSEGLLILTNDKNLSYKLLEPKFEHQRTYFIQVDGMITPEAILELTKGVEINVKGVIYPTLPAHAEAIAQPSVIKERNPPIRFRQNIPTSWVKLSIKEGKNHQVRKMTAKVGFPTLRLIRYSTEKLNLEGIQVGEVKEFDKNSLYKLLNIED